MHAWIVVAAAAILGANEAAPPNDEIRAAVEKGLRRIEQGSSNYPKHRNCFSCHHQALPTMALTSAMKRGFAVEGERVKKVIDFSLSSFAKKENIAKGQGIGGANTTVLYALAMFDAASYAPDDTTKALVEFLLVRQRKDGAWPAVTNRPPTEGSSFTNAALALWLLEKFGKKTDGEELGKRVNDALAKCRAWLLANQPATMEDRVFHLRALTHAGADDKQIDEARHLLLKEQHADGSWSQLPDLNGDVYATATALMALRLTGMPTDSPEYRRGTKYLLGTQRDDGGWIVQTRSKPIQVFFDNGDPGDKSQFISFTATSWAVLALLETFPVIEKKP